MDARFDFRSPTGRLIAGLLFTIAVIGAYAAFTLRSVQQMRETQTRIVERNRLAALQLIRIQSELNSLALALRDMVENRDGYPLAAWRPALARTEQNLNDAIQREGALSEGRRTEEQTAYLRTTFADFWRAKEALLQMAERGDAARAGQMVRDTLQPRQEALSALTARLLVEANERDSRAGVELGAIYSDVERNAYIFLGLSVLLIAATSLGLIRATGDFIVRLTDLAEQRRELARQLITTQESTLRAISRDLHDEFGQILTAVGALLRRVARHDAGGQLQGQVQEVSEIVQATLEKIRSLSQSLQPMILEEQGLLAAVRWHVANFQRHSGIEIHAELPESLDPVPAEQAIHVYRILQESLNNVARHAEVGEAVVRLENEEGLLRLTVEDAGRGISASARPGIGLAAMRERAEYLKGKFTVEKPAGGGVRIVLELPVRQEVEIG